MKKNPARLGAIALGLALVATAMAGIAGDGRPTCEGATAA